MKKISTLLFCALVALTAVAQKQYVLKSPDGRLSADISAGKELTYSVALGGTTVITPSAVSLTLSDGTVIGADCAKAKATRSSVNKMIPAPLYRADSIRDNYNQLTLRLSKDWSVEFRAYNDGVAYRFTTSDRKPFTIKNEAVTYNFANDGMSAVPYVVGRSSDVDSFKPQFFNSFENTYTNAKVTELDAKRLAFLPLTVEAAPGIKVTISESDVNSYPGLYLNNRTDAPQMYGVFAPVPKKMHQGGHNELQMLVDEREDYIAKVDGPRNFPWRIAVVTDKDKDLAATNLTYLLGEPSRIADTSWIKPGKVAWDWWNAWGLYGVPFRAGINNDTYKAYIDFASDKGIEYVILDEGWAVNKKADLFQVVPEINLEELVEYANKKNVGLILWAGYLAFDREMERVCKHYADMGIKGFKVDFMDRDDQLITDFNYRAADMTAKYNLVLDLHGASKPAGINRTYPNVLNVEGVHGLEQMKWAGPEVDQVTYDVMIPFLRQVGGPMDYTQGAMNNANKKDYKSIYYEPMSQGTRCRQLALYMVLDSPLNMLCDTPSNYLKEEECTEFIAGVPTVWDETVVLDGKMGEYIVTARRSGDTWYVGGLTNWDPRDLEIDLSFLAPGQHEATIFADGINADRAARDYAKSTRNVQKGEKLKVHLAPGGGVALKIK